MVIYKKDTKIQRQSPGGTGFQPVQSFQNHQGKRTGLDMSLAQLLRIVVKYSM
jgi:hypothetical protein